ncbi:hypothetical protein [Capnocytophaga gingivalis]|uniref:Lipoprotein n=1 Tax=Capnocytophaga gingivalis TaxID=1017 RepID=A0ABU5Y8J9_9FLAO|nr:hypothetical protein [Capnocytophaga gingivalis]MEB3040247.1 hypothetical protein [Capnocytophaga gingivalis]
MKKMTLLASLLALFSCKRATEERKATEAFAIQSLLTYEYCGEKDGFQYFLLGNQWERKVFKIKSSEIHIDPQYAFYADPSFEPKIPITPVEQERVFAEIPMNGQKLYLYKNYIVPRYFLSCSDLHKKGNTHPTYLYDEVSQQEAEAYQEERAYYIGYYQGEKLIRYQKIYRGEVFMEKRF